MVRSIVLAVALLPSLFAQNNQRSKLSDYPVQAHLPQFEIGADYLIHNIPTEKRAYSADDFLVVEVALFPAKGDERLRISRNDFTLRLDDKKIIDTVSPGAVASALRVTNWTRGTDLSADPSLGDGTSIGGAVPGLGRYPSDPNNTLPPGRSPQSQNTDERYGVGSEGNFPIEQAISMVALPDGLVKKPVKGCLYFQFDGKLKSIHSLDLVYTGENGVQTALALVQPRAK